MYTSTVPCDIDAAVIANSRLSDDYSVLALAAPEIASLARPGQFVMVKPAHGHDPLLRRPFSIFEILRDADGAPAGISILNKRVGAGTRAAVRRRSRARVCRARPARPAVRTGRSAGAGLDGRRRRRARAVRHAGRGARRARHAGDAVLRRPARRRSSTTSTRSSALGVRHRAGDRRRQPRRHGLRHRAARTTRFGRVDRVGNPVQALRLRPDADDARRSPRSPSRTGAPATSRSSR